MNATWDSLRRLELRNSRFSVMRIRRHIRRISKAFHSSYSKIWLIGIVLLVIWNYQRDRITDLFRRNRNWYIPDAVFFKPTLYLKPAQQKKTGIKFFKEKREASPDFRLNGFRYCAALDNSWFYGNVFLDKLNGTVMAVNPIRQILLDLIDDTAKNITDFIYDRSPSGIEHDVKRLACYLAAQGNNQMANLSDSVFLRSIHVNNYFKEELPALSRNFTRHPRLRRKFRLAYYILILDQKELINLENLLKVVDDGSAFILIQIDDRVYQNVQKELSSVLKQSRNIVVAKTLYLHVQGHISKSFSLLNGYFELMDAASWDYVINLSAMDWPLRSNKEIYSILKGYGQQKSWISLWRDSKWVAHRLFRPHVSIKSGNGYANYHSEDFGISYWPMTNWRLFRNSPWTILSRNAVTFLRDSDSAFQYLAFLEHTYEPEELFIATSLLNSAEIQGHVNMDSLRYYRDDNKLIGYQDRHLFPLDEKVPRYLFMRPFDSNGKWHEEKELISWIKKKREGVDVCEKQVLMDNDCLKAFLDRISFEDHIILIPIIAQKYSSLVKNLECSLNRLGYTNVVMWTFEQKIHAEISKLGFNSLYDPIRETGVKLEQHNSFEREIAERKLSIILKLIKSGSNVFYIDPASVVLKDFLPKLRQYSQNPYNADIMLGSNDESLINIDSETLHESAFDSDVLYVRQTSGAIALLARIKKYLDENPRADFVDGLNSMMHQGNAVQVTGFGSTPQDPLYPTGNEKIETQKDNHFGSDLTHLFKLGFSRPAENQTELSRIHILDPLEFGNRKMLQNKAKIGSLKQSITLIHASNEKDVEKLFKEQKLWYLDSNDICIRN